MKKTFILACCTSLLFACNNNHDNTATKSGTSDHGSHHETTSTTDNQNNRNAIHKTMDDMMTAMHGTKPTGNNDIDFSEMMVAHHKGAVEMSKVEIEKGTNAELKSFAQKVIDDQNKEIAIMQNFISKAPKTASPNSADFQKEMNQSMAVMMSNETPNYNNIDKDFAAQMIPHHQSAVDMAKAYLKHGKDNSLRTLCQNIIDSQTKEINWLKEWLAKNKS